MLNSLSTLVVVVQVISALVIIGLVLLQHGKGADMGASFGSGASGSLFGATGSSNFLSKSTAIAVAIFFISTLVLTSLRSNKAPSVGVMDNLPAATATPAASASAAVTAPVVDANKDAAKDSAKDAAKEAAKSTEIPK